MKSTFRKGSPWLHITSKNSYLVKELQHALAKQSSIPAETSEGFNHCTHDILILTSMSCKIPPTYLLNASRTFVFLACLVYWQHVHKDYSHWRPLTRIGKRKKQNMPFGGNLILASTFTTAKAWILATFSAVLDNILDKFLRNSGVQFLPQD